MCFLDLTAWEWTKTQVFCPGGPSQLSCLRWSSWNSAMGGWPTRQTSQPTAPAAHSHRFLGQGLLKPCPARQAFTKSWPADMAAEPRDPPRQELFKHRAHGVQPVLEGPILT